MLEVHRIPFSCPLGFVFMRRVKWRTDPLGKSLRSVVFLCPCPLVVWFRTVQLSGSAGEPILEV